MSDEKPKTPIRYKFPRVTRDDWIKYLTMNYPGGSIFIAVHKNTRWGIGAGGTPPGVKVSGFSLSPKLKKQLRKHVKEKSS